nr:copia protein [Tanacetum cinerariifolium]
PTQAWLWHRRLSHLNFDYIKLLSKKDIVIGLPKLKYVKDQLFSSCELIKAKRSSFKSKAVPSSKGRLNLLHMDLCILMRVASINWKKYILKAMADSAWIEAMQEELHHLDRFQDEDQTVIRNKARLVAKGTQVFSNLSDGRENSISQWSTGDIHFLEALLSDDSIPFPNNESSESDFDNSSVPRPPPEPPDADFELDSGDEILVVMNSNDKLECLNPRDDFDDDDYFSFMFVIYSRMFLSFLSAESEDTIFDPGISV